MLSPDDPLTAIPFANSLSSSNQELLRRNISEIWKDPGADILAPGDIVDGVYFVRSGAIRIYYIDADGREGTLYWIEPKESCILALNSLFTKIPYPAFAAAAETGVDIVTVSGSVFRSLFAAEPHAQSFLFEQLTGRVFSLLQTLEHTMRLPQEERLILLLLAIADKDQVVPLSQDQLARHLGTVREVVSRLLRNLVAQGLIELAPRRITILDRAKLNSLIDC